MFCRDTRFRFYFFRCGIVRYGLDFLYGRVRYLGLRIGCIFYYVGDRSFD